MTKRCILFLLAVFSVFPLTIADDFAESQRLLKLFPSDEELNQLMPIGRQKKTATFRIMGSTSGGTAFVISRQHRLLATNAHVIDEKSRMTVIQAATDRRFDIARYWKHPHYVDNDPTSADVAILQLSSNGPALQEEFKLAGAGHGDLVLGHALGSVTFGSSAYATDFPNSQYWWGPEVGIISNIERANVPDKKPWIIVTNQPNWGGSSGSPIFLTNGQVVGIHSGSRPFSTTVVSVNVLVDALWELLAQTPYEISPGVPCLHELPQPEREEPMQPSTEALADLAEAKRLMKNEELDASYRIVERLIVTHPRWVEPHVIGEQVVYMQHMRSHERPQQQTFHRCSEFVKSRFLHARFALVLDPTNIERHIALGYSMCSIASTHNNQHIAKNVEFFCRRWKNSDVINRELRAKLHGLYACTLKNQGQLANALEATNTAIALDAKYRDFYHTRSLIYDDMGMRFRAQEDLERFQAMK